MSPSWIRKRKTAKGETRHQVLYRRGGRETTIEAAGTFKLDREAKLRRDLVAGWLARGLDPKAELAKLKTAAIPPKPRTYADEVDTLIATRHDASVETIRGKQKSLKKIAELRPDLAAKPAADWTVSDVQELIAAMVAAGLAPNTIDRYIGDGPKLVLDNALGQANNPARDARVRLPRRDRDEVQPPTSRQVLAILEHARRDLVLPIIVLEQTAMRVGELVSLTWGDVDVAGDRFRLQRGNVKTRRARWVQVPAALMDAIADTCPLEDRTATRRVFPTTTAIIRHGMARACRDAGIPLYSPHDLRHRRASLWHGQGLTVAEMKERGGWAKAEIALDVYSHVMPLDEMPPEALKRVLAGRS